MTLAPYYDDLAVGDRFANAPAMTLTSGAAAVHQAIVGDRLPLALDAARARDVLGADGQLAHPALVWDVAIGQSTVVTGRVIANLFYRGLVLRRLPLIGDTLRTTTEVVALRDSASRPAGLAVLRIRTVDQHDRPVLDFLRCALLPRRADRTPPGHDADLARFEGDLDDGELRAICAGWRLGRAADGAGDGVAAGARWELEGGDVVSGAPELARLTLNVAMAHHDRAVAGGRRLVYGGHTIGIAAAQAARAVPGLLAIVGWHSCDHVAPVYEGDTLRSEILVERRDGPLAHLRSLVVAEREDGTRDRVLDWRFVGVIA